MRGIRLNGLLFGVVLLAFTLSGMLTCPVSADAEKGEKDVRIIGFFDLTGPYSAHHALLIKGIKTFVEWVNQTNYVPGVNIIHDIYDTGCDMGKTVAAYQLATSRKPAPVITTGGLASPTILAIKPLAKRRRIPCIDGSSARPIVRPASWTFSVQACYEGMIGSVGDWIKANWKPDSKVEWIREHYEDRNPRFAIMGWDNAFGRGFDQKEGRAYLKHIGVDFIGAEYVSITPSDTSAQLMRLKKKNVDFIFFGMYPSSHALILKDAAVSYTHLRAHET